MALPPSFGFTLGKWKPRSCLPNDSFINFTFHFVVNLLTKLLPSAGKNPRPRLHPHSVQTRICVYFLVLLLRFCGPYSWCHFGWNFPSLFSHDSQSNTLPGSFTFSRYWANWHAKARFQFGIVLLLARTSVLLEERKKNHKDFKAILSESNQLFDVFQLHQDKLNVGWVPLCYELGSYPTDSRSVRMEMNPNPLSIH